MDKQAQEAREMAKALPSKEKLSHIWTYYRGWFMAALIAVVMIGTTVYQLVSKPSYDLEISYYGKNVFTQESLTELEEYLAQFVDDVDGDGVQTVHIHTNFLSNLEHPNQQQNMGIMQKQMAEISAGTYTVFLFDKNFADSIEVGSYEGMLQPLRDMESVPQIKAIIALPENQKLCWATRIPFDVQDNQKRLEIHQRSAAVETAIFGE